MNIEYKFLQKAIEDKNYVGFTYVNEKYEQVKPLKLLEKENITVLKTSEKNFEFNKISKLKILKNRF